MKKASLEPDARPQERLRDFILIKKACKGNHAAFKSLVILYEKRVRVLGYGFFRNTADTDDFVQDVFIKAYTNLQSFRFQSRFSTWLMSIAYNTAVNTVNRRKEYLPLIEGIELFDRDYGPEEQAVRTVLAEAIREAVQALPYNFAVCLDLYFFYDFPYNEIAVITGWPLNTVKSNIFRAKKLLKQKLEPVIQP
ncbi:sigma-70 family RNA polymerase sigma factor [Treponema sp. HNW]|uniref:RNA polymerase sigma factor n=1 Tax=Treponema sp. HNW TaxID=3116654 RepID=UPI003D0A34CE